jgi:hypothetical protein
MHQQFTTRIPVNDKVSTDWLVRAHVPVKPMYQELGCDKGGGSGDGPAEPLERQR